MAPEDGDGPRRSGQHDPLHPVLVDQLGERGGDSVKMTPALRLDVALIP
jgi:hypothetical protein